MRSRFPDPNEDSLAGGLANTIAGRIANHFDLRGGAYSVDGACASSLVALADAANLLISEQADAVLVAAVDLSLDPFELVGFSRNGALAAEEMRVFDAFGQARAAPAPC
jgi:enediyne polyketide synthase